MSVTDPYHKHQLFNKSQNLSFITRVSMNHKN